MGQAGHTSAVEAAELGVPPTLKAAIAARIERLMEAKRAWSPAAVSGMRFDADLLRSSGGGVSVLMSWSWPSDRPGRVYSTGSTLSAIR